MEDLQAGDLLLGDVSRDCSNEENHVMGLDSDFEGIKDRLTRGFRLHLEALTIVGMGGIGKTTLARRLFYDPSVQHYFHIRLWVTVSQEYHVRKMLASLLGGLHFVCNHYETDDAFVGNLYYNLKGRRYKTDDALGEILYKNLKGRRYLIVMDDVWSTKALDEVRIFFPNDKNGSRILLTSRLADVAIHLNSDGSHHMSFLNEDDGWKLLHQKLFGKEKCPPELEDIGRKIVKKCQGLPLALNVVAGYLHKINRTPDCWTKVAESVASYVTEDPEQCLDIIALSYNHLPHHLKACFLYMGAFPADFAITSKRLIRFWIAEGFLDQVETKSLENVAEEWLEDLIGRHLIMVRKGSHGRIKICHMHDLVRDLCLREAKKENFLHHYPEASYEGINYPCRVIFQSYDTYVNLSTAQIHSLLCFQNLCADFFVRHRDFKVLTVLYLHVSHFRCFPSEIIQFVNLRYLALSIDEGLPSSISCLLNLQIFILDCYFGGTTLPWQIWNLPQLRHLHCKNTCFLPDPSGAENDGKSLLGLPNLQTLSKLGLSSCNMRVFAALPNLKKLGICETAEAYLIERSWSGYYWNSETYGSVWISKNSRSNLDNVAQLHQLETLKLIFLNVFTQEPQWIPRVDAFPPKLKKLTLSFSYFPWEYMDILCMLPNLEVLKLKNYAFTGQEWEQHGEGFGRLKFFLLEVTDLVHWKAASISFPCLEHLVLKFCNHLQQIPLDIGEISTLQIIEVHGCSYSAAMSAKEIQLEQQSMGNDALDVRITDPQRPEWISSSADSPPYPSVFDNRDPIPRGHSSVYIKELMLLGLVGIILWQTSGRGFLANIKKLTRLALILIVIWQVSRS